MTPRCGALLGVVLVVATLHTPLSAQGVTGAVRHGITSAPLPGVLVSVLDLDGERVRSTLTDEVGRYVIQVPMGRYRLSAERIGLAREVTEPFDVRTLNLLPMDLYPTEHAVAIAGLVVDVRVQSCRVAQDDAVRIQRWWGEIRTALRVSSALQDQPADFRVERFQREWDPALERISGMTSSVERNTSSRPFISLDAETLQRNGYVEGDVDGRAYNAPDADVLTSSAFLADHCFSIDRHEGDEPWIGLGFEPIQERAVSDIHGTLWVDTTTAELRRLDFRYTDIEGVPENRSGGQVTFDYLANGAWIVSEWYIRMPRLGLRPRRPSRVELFGYRDVGGRATPLVMGAVAESTTFGRIEGIVFDSVAGRGLAGATVSILGTRFQATTDSAGAFLFERAPTGSRMLTFFHADPTAWGLGSPLASVEVDEGRTARARLAIPPFQAVATALCMGTGTEAGTLLVGRLVGPDGEPLVGTEMEFSWQLNIERDRARAQVYPAQTGTDGRFVVCGLPTDVQVFARARIDERWVDLFGFRPDAGGVEFREVRVRAR